MYAWRHFSCFVCLGVGAVGARLATTLNVYLPVNYLTSSNVRLPHAPYMLSSSCLATRISNTLNFFQMNRSTNDFLRNSAQLGSLPEKSKKHGNRNGRLPTFCTFAITYSSYTALQLKLQTRTFIQAYAKTTG